MKLWKCFLPWIKMGPPFEKSWIRYWRCFLTCGQPSVRSKWIFKANLHLWSKRRRRRRRRRRRKTLARASVNQQKEKEAAKEEEQKFSFFFLLLLRLLHNCKLAFIEDQLRRLCVSTTAGQFDMLILQCWGVRICPQCKIYTVRKHIYNCPISLWHHIKTNVLFKRWES